MRRSLVVLSLLCLLVPGCGKSSAPTAHLAGTVTINGAPIPSDAEAGLSIKPIDGGEAVSVPITDGHYDSPNTPLGEVSVKFYITQEVGPVRTSDRTGEQYRDTANLVPPGSAAGTAITVTADNLDQNFDL